MHQGSPSDFLSARQIDDLFTRAKRSRVFRHFDLVQLLFCILIIVLHLLVLDTGRFNRAENIFLDYFFRQRPLLSVTPSLVIIEIDQESLEAIGSWPWPWNYHARMIRLLTQWGAKAIVFDWVFRDEQALPEEKLELQKAIQDSGHVYLPVTLEPKSEKKIWVHSLPILLEPKGGRVWIHSPKELEQFAKRLGHLMTESDEDGVLRKVPWILQEAGEEYLYLPLRVAFDFLGKDPADIPRKLLPKEDAKTLLINWAGKWNQTFKRYVYADLVRSDQALQQGRKPVVDPSEFKDKICLLGFTAKDQAVLKITPLENNFPSLGVQANVINNLLTRQYITPVSPRVHAISLFILGLLASFLFAMIRNIPTFIAGLVLGFLWFLTAFGLFVYQGVWVFVFHPLFLILSLFIFSAIYNLILSAQERKRLYALATRDGLTGLYVIRHFREILNQIVQLVKKTQEPLSLILIDIDDFKKINDTYGHPAGDLILKKTAQTLAAYLRSKRSLDEMDFLARYGGEEFIVLLRGSGLKEAAFKVAVRLRQAVESADFEWKGTKIPVTISLGVSTLEGHENVPDPMVHRADEALYNAKRQGKNRVCTSTITIS